MISNLKRISILTAAAVMGACSWALAATPVNVSLNSSKYMQAPKITRIAIGNPEIADVRMLSARDYLLIGKKAGSTSLIVWSANGVREEYSVYVSGDDQGMASAIQQAIGYPGITAQMMNGKVLLRGTVKISMNTIRPSRLPSFTLGAAEAARLQQRQRPVRMVPREAPQMKISSIFLRCLIPARFAWKRSS